MSMRKIREVLRLTHELGFSVRAVCEATGVGKTAVGDYVRRAKLAGITWPIPAELGDADLERLLFAPADLHGGRGEAAAGLGEGACRTQAPQRDADDAVGGASRRARRRLRIFAVLRALRRMAPAAVADDAADLRGGRQAVRRLGRRHGADHRCDDGRGA